MQSGKYRFSSNHQTRHSHPIARQRSVIHHSREHISTAPESSGSMLYTTASDDLHCTCCFHN
ncbi:unnamed protein product [Staurois parvus]|uniref:Uncharacterized protein n=1 Tax=Staurois parvus TaxID=386267 RepID=A0ABN9HK13_9NEOB|nr:unnamed protein product [Staurois parvus]